METKGANRLPNRLSFLLQRSARSPLPHQLDVGDWKTASVDLFEGPGVSPREPLNWRRTVHGAVFASVLTATRGSSDLAVYIHIQECLEELIYYPGEEFWSEEHGGLGRNQKHITK